jgi:GTP-binding protein Era
VTDAEHTRFGHVVIAGRPNVGKSTLMNRILGVHLAAATPKPQTTRNRILGIHTHKSTQIVFIDTPGIHDEYRKLLNRRLNKTAITSLSEGDVIVFMIEAGKWKKEDEHVLAFLRKEKRPTVLVINKIDRIGSKNALLPFLKKVQGQYEFAEIIPISAFSNESVGYLIKQLDKYIPLGSFQYSGDDITDRSMRFVAAEMVREQLTQMLEKELPYSLAVEIEEYKEADGRVEISAVIYVLSEGQKRIVIGHKGKVLKQAGTKARLRIAGILGHPVHLNLWVKVKSGWTENSRMLDQLNFDAGG